MSLSLSASYSAIRPGLQSSFQASGGTEPYVYSVNAGGAGGTIDPDTGVYTAPALKGIDVITVTDDDTNTAQLPILIGGPLELFCDVIRHELGLSDDQVFLWDQKYNVPVDSRMYVSVRILMLKPFGTSNVLDSSGNSVQSVNMQASLDVNFESRSLTALDRKEEFILALSSNYSEAQQEANSFYIAQQSKSFLDLSEEDGPAIPYRFTMSVVLMYAVTKTTAVPYYNDFLEPEITVEP